MPRPVITTLTVDEKHSRLDGQTDQLFELAFKSGDTRWLAARIGETSVSGLLEVPPVAPKAISKTKKSGGFSPNHSRETGPTWRLVSIPARRTLKASLADFVDLYPGQLRSRREDAASDLWRLSRDDKDRRDRDRRLKREWRVHEYVVLAGGTWLARLSCSQVDKLYGQTQYVIEGAPKEPSIRAHTMHLSKRQGGSAERIWSALRNTWYAGELPTLLADVSEGFNAERDAKAFFEKRIRQFAGPIADRRVFDVANAVRQVGPDRDVAVSIVETYAGVRDDAYLLETDRGWYVMSVERSTTFSAVPTAQLLGGGTGWKGLNRIAFDTPVATARLLLAHSTPRSQAMARDTWVEMIRRDLVSRIWSEGYDGHWLISAQAKLADDRLALKLTCLFPPKARAPSNAPRPYWQILVVDSEACQILPLPAGRLLTGLEMRNPEYIRLFHEAYAAVGTAEDAEARKTLAKDYFCRALWDETAGFSLRQAVDDAWEALTAGAIAIELVDGDADPVPRSLTEAQISQEIGRRRAELEERIAQQLDDPDELTKFDRRIDAATTFPQQLVALSAALAKKVNPDVFTGDETLSPAPNVSANPADVITVDANEVPMRRVSVDVADENSVDAFGCAGHGQAADKEHQEPPPVDTTGDEIIAAIAEADVGLTDANAVDAIGGPSGEPAPALSQGRRRIHADDAARKRAWASKARAAARVARQASGVLPKKSGRPRLHASAAARQKAYEERKRQGVAVPIVTTSSPTDSKE